MKAKFFLIIACVASFAALCACSKTKSAKSAKAAPPAKIENAVKEAELTTVKLSPIAEERLGVVTKPVSIERVAHTRTFAGEVVVPPDRTISVSAPVAGTLSATTPLTVGAAIRKSEQLFRLYPLLPAERDLRIQLDRDVTNAQTRVDAVRIRFNRAEQLLRERAGS